MLRRTLALAIPQCSFPGEERGWDFGLGQLSADFVHEIADPRHGFLDLFQACRVAAANEAFSAPAESAAGNAGDLFAVEETERKLPARKAGTGDARENIK